MREIQGGRPAAWFVAVLLLGLGAALGFIAASAAARDEVTELSPARAANLGALYTVTQAVVHKKTVRVIAEKQAARRPRKTLTVTEPSTTLRVRTVARAPTRTVTRTIRRLRTVTVTDVQPTTVTVVVTVTKKGKP